MSSSSTSTTPWYRRLPRWAWVVGVATVAGLFFVAQIYYSSLSFRQPVSWVQALYWSFGDWYEWALLAPLIFLLCRRFPFSGKEWRLSAPVFVVGAVGLSLLHGVMCAAAAKLQCIV